MPRAYRFMQPGLLYHLTHRCHNRSFLFRFARDRSEYRDRLRHASRQFGVSLLNYSITSNHIHSIVVESRLGAISRMMQKLEGDFASFYNRRKHRTGSFWGDRYHCTMVEDGEHLWNCIEYVDLNMVRAGVVSHPGDWSWCGFMELVGLKNRYRLIDMELLIKLLGYRNRSDFAEAYSVRIRHAIQAKVMKRDGRWTESIAVGSEPYVKKIATAIINRRRKMRIEEHSDGSWLVREELSSYDLRACLGVHGQARALPNTILGRKIEIEPIISAYISL